MYLTRYFHIFWMQTLIPVMCMFDVYKPSYDVSAVQNRSIENNSQLLQENAIQNVSSHGFRWLTGYKKTLSQESSWLTGYNKTPSLESSWLTGYNKTPSLEASWLTGYNTTPSQESSWLDEYNQTLSAITSTELEPDDGVFYWNKITMTAQAFQSYYCSRQRLDKSHMTLDGSDTCPSVTCFPCDCENPICEFYGTCCPEYETPSVDSKTAFENTPSARSKNCVDSNIAKLTMHVSKDTNIDIVCGGNGHDDSLSKRSCPKNYPDDEVKSKCQKNISSTQEDLGTFLHVTDIITGYTFYNMYCAACNNVTDFATWSLSVKCNDYMTVYTSMTPTELLRLSLAEESGCETFQEFPDDLMSYPCRRHWFSSTIIDTCNVTGKWDVFDDDVVKACTDISGLVNRVRVVTGLHGGVYKNLFCAICNMVGYPNVATHCEESHLKQFFTRFSVRLPFSMLLNFESQERLTTRRRDAIKCSQDSEWTSPDNKCLSLQCSPGKILTNGSCSTALSQIRGLLYQIHAYYVPSVAIEMTVNTQQVSQSQEKYLRSFQNQIKRAVRNIVYAFQISLSGAFSHKTFPMWENQTEGHVNTSRPFQINSFTVDGYILADQSLSRDEVETSIVSELILNNITVDIDTDTTLTLMPVLRPPRKQAQTTCNSGDSDKMSCIFSLLVLGSGYFKHVSEKHQPIIIEPLLNCEFVQFDKTEYLYENDIINTPHNSSITLYFNGARITFSDRTELNMVSIDEDGTLRICHELLTTKIPISDDLISSSVFKISLYILTLICIICSIISLTMTLMTYFLFPVLRSVAGKNNIFLCLSLLIAQLSLLASSHVPEIDIVCTILAIFTHCLWLSMFCWCFTCCLHMFCIFSAKIRSIQATTNSEMAYMTKRVIACCVIPGLIVTGNIITNYYISGGQLIGYGSFNCFLDAPLLVIITLVVPMCLIIVINLIFFSITIIKIHSVGKLQTGILRKDDRNNLFIYIKLSSMTGIFWILSVISEATDNDPLRCIAIGLNGLQGVFIFVSYICNRRVLRLYLKLLGLEEYVSTTSNSSRSTVTKVGADIDKSHRCDDGVKSG